MLLMGGSGDLQEVFVFDCILVWNFVSTCYCNKNDITMLLMVAVKSARKYRGLSR